MTPMPAEPRARWASAWPGRRRNGDAREPKDERDERIEELERQVGALPRLSLRLPDDQEGKVEFETLDERAVPAEFLAGIGQAILERNPGVERNELMRKHNLPRCAIRAQHWRVSFFSVNVEQIDTYCEEYHQVQKNR